MIKISFSKFIWEIISAARVFEVCTTYQPAASDDNLWKNEDNSDDLSNVSIWLCKRYWDFFNTHNADQLVSHQTTDHAIELQPGFKSSYMHIYNMFPAELKALDDYINDALIKSWICESQSSADTSILFVFQKNEELCLCVLIIVI